ncbi:cysteine protease, partial [Elysia marginata]
MLEGILPFGWQILARLNTAKVLWGLIVENNFKLHFDWQETAGAVNVGTFTYESGPLEYEDFPVTEDPVFILGEPYNALHDREAIKYDIQSRFWITYRRNFQTIGTTGPGTDTGWGCMLRCGQMMMAQALTLHHLGR